MADPVAGKGSAACWDGPAYVPPSSFDGWAAALAGPLELFFEVNLPSRPSYRAWLRDHLDERVPIPYLREKAEASGSRLEGATKADVMLVARGTGVAVIGLYGWLMPAYRDPDGSLLQQHLPHRDGQELAEVAKRLGWASWEDCNTLVPGACPWLAVNPGVHEDAII